MNLPDLLAECAAEALRAGDCAVRVWLFDTARNLSSCDVVPQLVPPEPDPGDAFGASLAEFARKLRQTIWFIPTAAIVLIPWPTMRYLDGAAVGEVPARLPLRAAAHNQITLPTPADESVAAAVLESVRESAYARFN